MYAQEGSIRLTRDAILADWKITPGPLLAGAIWDAADFNQDSLISQEEALAWIEPVYPLWSARLDGQQSIVFQVQSIHWPDSFDSFEAGSEPIEVQISTAWPQTFSGKHILEIHNTFQEPISLNWFSLSSDQGLTFDEPEQNSGQLDVALYFPVPQPDQTGGQTIRLTSWESGKPNVPGLTGAIVELTANLANAENTPSQASHPTSPTAALIGLVKTGQFSPLFLIGAFFLSIALGALHALTPGHGKTLVAAYLVGSHGRTRDAIFLGSVVTITHTGSVLLLGLLTLIASHYILPALVTPWLEILSGLFIILFGLNLLIRRSRDLLARFTSERAKKYARRDYSIKAMDAISEKTTLAASVHYHGPGLHHYHHHQDDTSPGHLEHGHSYHTHNQAFLANQVTWKSLLALGISGGLVPCPDAIAILLVAVTVNKIPFGMLLIVAFSFGLALVLIAIGIAMVQGFKLLSQNELINRFSLYSPVVSAVVVLGVGIGLTLTSLNSFSATSIPSRQSSTAQDAQSSPGPTSSKLFKLQSATQPAQNFNLKQAKVLYLAQDNANHDQLFVVPVSGGEPTPITREASGVLAYTVSKDRKTILYSVLNMDGESSIWGMNQDGTNLHLVLDCKQAECGGPVWSPDQEKLFYERHDYSQNTALPIFSIWWLDLAGGETKPVFQDQSFPSFAPRFSPDGNWLSYISPSTNTIQIYNLNQDRSLSIPYRSGIPQIWSPASDTLLLWDYASEDTSSSIHLKKFDLASGQTLDLGGALNQGDYLADWSPDGQWIAVVRDGTSSTDSRFTEQIVLLEPDGKIAATLLDLPDSSFGDLSWSPDSRYLVFSRYSNTDLGTPETWIMDVRTDQVEEKITAGSQAKLLP
jgi:ABC-type nickel/cobalt efflux system permease component RcnA/Tol biopolymer transport system component